jgi:hypothetical protein
MKYKELKNIIKIILKKSISRPSGDGVAPGKERKRERELSISFLFVLDRSQSVYRSSNGTGFMGVQQLMQQPPPKTGRTFHFKKRKHKWEEEEDAAAVKDGGDE